MNCKIQYNHAKIPPEVMLIVARQAYDSVYCGENIMKSGPRTEMWNGSTVRRHHERGTGLYLQLLALFI